MHYAAHFSPTRAPPPSRAVSSLTVDETGFEALNLAIQSRYGSCRQWVCFARGECLQRQTTAKKWNSRLGAPQTTFFFSGRYISRKLFHKELQNSFSDWYGINSTPDVAAADQKRLADSKRTFADTKPSTTSEYEICPIPWSEQLKQVRV